MTAAGPPGPGAILPPRDLRFPAAMLGVLAAVVPMCRSTLQPTEPNQLIATQSSHTTGIRSATFGRMMRLAAVAARACTGSRSDNGKSDGLATRLLSSRGLPCGSGWAGLQVAIKLSSVGRPFVHCAD
jgi:hypothetical protein